jgi:hypothetical protein
MKYAVLAMALAMVPATASATDYQVFQGDVFFITDSIEGPKCANSGFRQYDYLRMAVMPASSVNGTNTQINLFGPRVGLHFQITNHALSGSGSYAGTGLSSKGNLFTWNGTFSAASTTPATITNSTKSISVKVTLVNFASGVGCKATIAGTLGLRPDL